MTSTNAAQALNAAPSSAYLEQIADMDATIAQNAETWKGISAEYAVRMQLQNRFKTGLDIARYTADIMRRDMADYDADPAHYTQSLGCWHGFTAQQLAMSVKKHRGTMDLSLIHI